MKVSFNALACVARGGDRGEEWWKEGEGIGFLLALFFPQFRFFAPLLLKFSFNEDSDDVTNGNNNSNNNNSEPRVNLIKLLHV